MSTDVDRRIWHLRKVPAFLTLPPAVLSSLAEASELHERPRKTTLYLPGDIAEHVYFLHGGRVSALHVATSCRTINLGLYGAADVFGESCLWTTAPRDDMAVTTTAVVYSKVPRACLRVVCDEHPQAERVLMQQAVGRRDATIRRLCTALGRGVRARLADRLLELGELGRETPEGRELAFPITHHELAALIGTTRETVSLELQRLTRERLIARRGRRILLRDLPRLRLRARDDPPLRSSSSRRDPPNLGHDVAPLVGPP